MQSFNASRRKRLFLLPQLKILRSLVLVWHRLIIPPLRFMSLDKLASSSGTVCDVFFRFTGNHLLLFSMDLTWSSDATTFLLLHHILPAVQWRQIGKSVSCACFHFESLHSAYERIVQSLQRCLLSWVIRRLDIFLHYQYDAYLTSQFPEVCSRSARFVTDHCQTLLQSCEVCFRKTSDFPAFPRPPSPPSRCPFKHVRTHVCNMCGLQNVCETNTWRRTHHPQHSSSLRLRRYDRFPRDWRRSTVSLHTSPT